MNGKFLQLESLEHEYRVVYPEKDTRSNWSLCMDQKDDYKNLSRTNLRDTFKEYLEFSVFLPIELVYLEGGNGEESTYD